MDILCIFFPRGVNPCGVLETSCLGHMVALKLKSREKRVAFSVHIVFKRDNGKRIWEKKSKHTEFVHVRIFFVIRFNLIF